MELPVAEPHGGFAMPNLRSHGYIQPKTSDLAGPAEPVIDVDVLVSALKQLATPRKT